jgi:DNA polymerase III delta prime subunit
MHDYLKKALTNEQLPNTLLFLGDAVQDAFDLAEHLLEGKKIDLTHLLPDGKFHPIESIRNAIAQSHITPFEAKNKVFIIESAEKMLPATANALLKTLEEPSLFSYWILITDHPSELLPTIVSRCTRVYFPRKDAEVGEVEILLKSLLQPLPFHQLMDRLEELEQIFSRINAEKLQLKIDEALRFLARHTLHDPKWSLYFEELKTALERNMNLKFSLEVFFLRIYSN